MDRARHTRLCAEQGGTRPVGAALFGDREKGAQVAQLRRHGPPVCNGVECIARAMRVSK